MREKWQFDKLKSPEGVKWEAKGRTNVGEQTKGNVEQGNVTRGTRMKDNNRRVLEKGNER